MDAKLLHADQSEAHLGTSTAPEALCQWKFTSENTGTCKAWLYQTGCFEKLIARQRQLMFIRSTL